MLRKRPTTIAEQLIAQGYAEGFVEGFAEVREEGFAEGMRDGLRCLLTLQFGSEALDTRYESVLQSATREEINLYVKRALTTGSLAAVFER
jgi:flagellar biosynthesis/type III secretory pathway protein FliH